MLELPAFAEQEQRLNDVVTQRLSNALLQLQKGGQRWPCIHDVTLPERSPFGDVATQAAHSISVWMPAAAHEQALAEGVYLDIISSTWPAGQRCRIVTPVECGTGGWCSFDVSPQTII